jgi:HD-GYP domain-containing protein (c-di-GMP phosphodiesterase class II)
VQGIVLDIDDWVGDHNRRIVEYTDTLAEAIELSARQRANLRIAALYHDIGRVGIRRDPLQRPEAKSRPVVGESHQSRVIRIGEVLLAVLHQHERFDGTGVPAGLLGDEIPLLARILTTVKVFDALVSERSYQERSAVERAYETLQDEAGFQLDPELVDHFIAAHAHSRPTLVSD